LIWYKKTGQVRIKILEQNKPKDNLLVNKLPDDNQAIAIYVETYKDVYSNELDKNKLEHFENVLREILSSRLSNYNSRKP
jgi:hypothetical protein